MNYIESATTGVVHRADCLKLRRIAPANRKPWPADRPATAPGRTACPSCLPNGLPDERRPVELLEDPDGAPYQEAVQAFVRHLDLLPTGVDLDLLVAALEETSWYAWEDGNQEGQRADRECSINPHRKPEAEG